MSQTLLARFSGLMARRGGRLRMAGPERHRIDPAAVGRGARQVVRVLREGGYEGYVVGGAVRDLMLGLHPKDFDIATDARPEQVRNLFPRSRIIGRRFRLAHVRVGREVLEVATFRGGHRSRAGRAAVAVSLGGRILRDNAYGSIDQDAERRDFTVNALFYDPEEEAVLDFVGGVADVERRVLRMIGRPVTRYREDPVRLLRAARFAAKLGFAIDPAAERPIPELAHLLETVSPARLFDEVVKLLHGGAARAAFGLLREKGLFAQLFPRAEEALAGERAEELAFVERALENTDRRVRQELPVSPGFAYAVVMWPHVRQLLDEVDPGDFRPSEAMAVCADRALELQTRAISIPKHHAHMIREIWVLQPRLAAGPGRNPGRTTMRPYFRAGYDFLGLRAAREPELREAYAAWSRAQEEHPPDRYRRRAEEPAEEPRAAAAAKRRRRGRRGGRRR